MMEKKRVDRIYVDKKDLPDFSRLKEKDSPFTICQNKELFLAAMVVGFHEGGRIELKKKEGYFREEYLNDEERVLIRAIAVSTEGDLGVLLDEQKVYSIAEEYATGGISMLKGMVFSGEYGSYAKKLESDLLRTLENNMKNQPEEKNFDDIKDLSLIELIESGETHLVEFKSSLIWDFKRRKSNKQIGIAIVKTISCFMNSEGGYLIIGIDDKKKTIGIEQDLSVLGGTEDDFELRLTNLVNTYVGKINRPFIDVKFCDLEDKRIAKVSITKTPRPIFLEEGNKKSFFIRSGNSCQPLDVSEVTEYIKYHWSDL